jgi:drug/metabolite transporter (DMT)-like permease
MRSVHNSRAIIALIVANIIWGAASPIFKLALENIPPFTLAFFRFAGAALILIPFTRGQLLLQASEIPAVLLMTIFGITINIAFFFFGLNLSPSINAPVIASAGPIFLYLFSIFILHEHPKKRVLAGTIVSLMGVLTIIGGPILSQGFDGQLLGNFFLLVATMGSVGHAIAAKQLSGKTSTITVVFWTFLLGSLSFLPLFLIENAQLSPLRFLDWRGIFGLTFGIFLSSALAYTLYDWGLSHISTQDVGVFTYIDPLAAIIIAVPLLHEVITPIFLIGSLFVFAGIFVAEGRLPWHPLHRFV